MTFKLPFLRTYPPNHEYLQRLSLFADLTMPELAIVGHLLHERDYLAIEVIFDEGEVGQTIYFVLAGDVTICHQGRPDDGQLTRLGLMSSSVRLGLLDGSARPKPCQHRLPAISPIRRRFQWLDGQPSAASHTRLAANFFVTWANDLGNSAW